MIPDKLRYTSEHEWVSTGDDGGAPARIGITDFAQKALGDIVFVQLPAVGEAFAPGEAFGEVESTKSVSEVYAPFAGTVVARNERLTDEPELINSDPYGDGWLIEISPANPAAVDDLLDAAGYGELTNADG